MSDCGPKKTILVEIPNEHSIGVPVFRGVQEWLKPRVSWEFVGPQMGTYRHDWYEDPKQMMREVDAALVFGFFPWKKMIEVEELNGRLFLAGHKKELSMWWQVGAVDEDVGRLAASYLKKTGMSNYGFVGYETPSFNRARLRGFGEGLGLAQSDLWVIEHQNFIYSTAEGHTITMLDKHGEWINQLKDWMAGLPPRTALFCANDILGKDVVNTANLLGKSIPDNLSILGVDNLEGICTSVYPQLSSIDLQWVQLGHRMGELMLEVLSLENPPKRGGQIVFNDFFPFERETTRTSEKISNLLVKAKDYIREHLSENPTRPEVAKAIGTSDRSLARYLHEEMNTTFQEEKRILQLEKARSLLANSNHQVVEIATMCGFSSSSSFTRWLKTTTGLTSRQVANFKHLPIQALIRKKPASLE